MERRIVTLEQYQKMLQNNCNKGKHRLRTNKYGVTWCVICGLLSTVSSQELCDNDGLIIKIG